MGKSYMAKDYLVPQEPMRSRKELPDRVLLGGQERVQS